MRNRKKIDAHVRTDGLNSEHTSDFSGLDEALQAMVLGECERFDSPELTNQIMRAVRRSAIRGWRFEDLWAGFHVSWFRPVMVGCMVLALVLLAYNAGRTHSGFEQLTTTERVLGLHPVTVATAFDLDLEDSSR